MNESKIAVRYAKALFMTAVESNRLEQQTRDVRFLNAFLKETSEFNWLINSPVIPTSKKTSIFEKMFEKALDAATMGFLHLLLTNNREAYIPAICRNYMDIYRASKGIQSAHFQTAAPVDENTLIQVKSIAEKYFNTVVEMFPEVKPELLGGFVLRVGDKQLDSSASFKLEKIRRGLISTDFEVKY
ncbi:MAG: ATP synthase F1 subunit delta [Bacteroidales bacterium]|nr:ATP synthase F1 subunit delta [Bacteroidales bacterium]